MKSIFGFTTGNFPSNSHYPLFGKDTTEDTGVMSVIPCAGVIRNLTVCGDLITNLNERFTVHVNGAPTTLSVQIGGSTNAADNVNGVFVNAGDLVSILRGPDASGEFTHISVSCTFEPTE